MLCLATSFTLKCSDLFAVCTDWFVLLSGPTTDFTRACFPPAASPTWMSASVWASLPACRGRPLSLWVVCSWCWFCSNIILHMRLYTAPPPPVYMCKKIIYTGYKCCSPCPSSKGYGEIRIVHESANFCGSKTDSLLERNNCVLRKKKNGVKGSTSFSSAPVWNGTRPRVLMQNQHTRELISTQNSEMH